MEAKLAQDHSPPLHIQQPIFVQQQAVRASTVTESPNSRKTDSDSSRKPFFTESSPSGGAGPGDPEALSPELQAAQNRLESAKSTLHQLRDLLDGVIEGVSANGYGPNANKDNQRLLKSALSAAKEIISHAESNGEPTFRIQSAEIGRRQLHGSVQKAIAAYGAATTYTPSTTKDPSLVRQAMSIVQIHITGPNGVLADLQSMSESGPHGTSRVRSALEEAQKTLDGLQEVIGDTTLKLISQSQQARTNARASLLDRLL
jgi:hypothetical protein